MNDVVRLWSYLAFYLLIGLAFVYWRREFLEAECRRVAYNYDTLRVYDLWWLPYTAIVFLITTSWPIILIWSQVRKFRGRHTK